MLSDVYGLIEHFTVYQDGFSKSRLYLHDERTYIYFYTLP